MLQALLSQYSWLLYILIGAGVVFAFFAIAGFFQGRRITTPFGEIGEKASQGESTEAKSSQSLQQQIVYVTNSIDPEQLDEVSDRVAERVNELRSTVPNTQLQALHQPPPIPDRVDYILAVRYYIESKIREIVLSTGGHWAGSTWASFKVYLDYARTGNIISEELKREITDFYFYTQGNINVGSVPDVQFLEIQYLALNLQRKLEAIPLGSMQDEIQNQKLVI